MSTCSASSRGDSPSYRPWWESAAARAASSRGDTGALIRLARKARGETQEQTGRACGYSQSEISRIENGKTKAHDIRLLARMAAHLEIPRGLLGLACVDPHPGELLLQVGAGAPSLTVAPPGRRLNVMEQLTAAMSGGAVSPAPIRLGTVGAIEEHVAGAHRSYQQGQYDEAVALISQLFASGSPFRSSDVATDRRAVVAEGWGYIVAAKLATKFQLPLTARIAADRASTAALRSSSPVLGGAAAYQLSCALHGSSELGNAHQVAVLAAEQLATVGSDVGQDPALVSTRGALLLIAAIVAAQMGDGRIASQHLATAQKLTEGLRVDGNHAWTAFGPTNVRAHALATAVVLGDPNRAIRIGEAIDPDAFAPGLVGRRCQVHLDTAWGLTQRHKDSEAVIHLLLAERTGPQVVKYNATARSLVDELLRRGSRSRTPGLRQLAERVGVGRQ